MLAGAVDAGKGLFMEQADHVVPSGDLFHDLHCQLVVVAGGVGIGVDGRGLVLSGGHLVVLGFGEDAQLPKLLVQLLHIGGDPGLDGAEIVVLQLLALGRLGAKEGPAREDQILPLIIHILVNQEIFLLRTYLADDLLYICVTKEA